MPSNDRLIVFFIPPEKIVNGGILSIFSICEQSRKFKKIHGSEVVLSTYPGTNSYRKNDLFENDETIYSFDEIVEKGIPASLQLHIPEYASYDIFMALSKYSKYIKAIADLRVNIMTQNILLMQKPSEVASWFALTPHVTQTTAHNKYTTQELADSYYTPVFHLSTFVDPSQYHWVAYKNKKNIIGLSPDISEKKELIVKSLGKTLTNYKIVPIENMRYSEYKEFISTAKFIITFGEGFDGYYVEPFMSGGVTFAVYNDDFFPSKEFSKFENVYTNNNAMLNNVAQDIRRLDNELSYEKLVTKNFDHIKKLYNFASYQENIKKFYLGKFTYAPQKGSAERLIGVVVADKNKTIESLGETIGQKENEIRARNKVIEDLGETIGQKENEIRARNKVIEGMETSISWKITDPLRKASAVVKVRNKKE